MNARTMPTPVLTDTDRDIITRARKLAGAHELDALRAAIDAGPGQDVVSVHAEALGIAQYLLAEQDIIIKRLGGDGA